MVCTCCMAIILLLYMLFDVNYFLRIGLVIVTGRLFEKKKKIFESTTIYGFCTTQDVDIFLKHMNNARYLRELDFARFHYYDRTGIYAKATAMGAGAVQGASSARYRRAIPIFTPFKVVTKMVYWEGKHFYLEHRFISLSDNFIRAVVFSRQTLTSFDSVADILAQVDPEVRRPEPPKDLQLWLDSMEESSQKLKKGN